MHEGLSIIHEFWMAAKDFLDGNFPGQSRDYYGFFERVKSKLEGGGVQNVQWRE